MLWDAWQGNLIIDPVKEITSRTGKTALILLLLTLACTPANTLFGFPPALRIRRPLALYTFMYASLHVLTFVGLDYGFNLRWIGPALLGQQFTLPGLAAFLLLLLLAVTSTKGVTGHALGAAGAIEAAFTVLTVQHGLIPPTANLDSQDPEIDIDVVAKAPREAKVQVAMSDSFGFGGQNAVLIITAT